MTHVPHELREEFPQERSLIERLIKDNYQFRRLSECYDEVNRESTASSRKKRRPSTRYLNGSRSGA